MYGELELIRRGMIVNITLEELIGDLAERSGCEEIQQFSTILSVAKGEEAMYRRSYEILQN